MAYTILQASYFMEVWLTPALGFDYANGKVKLYGDGNHKLSWVSYKDVARFAVAALDQPRARNAVLDVGGPEALSSREVVRMFEAAGAAEISVESVPEAELESRLLSARDPMERSFAGLMLQCANGDVMDMQTTLELLPMRLTSVRDYVSARVAS